MTLIINELNQRSLWGLLNNIFLFKKNNSLVLTRICIRNRYTNTRTWIMFQYLSLSILIFNILNVNKPKHGTPLYETTIFYINKKVNTKSNIIKFMLSRVAASFDVVNKTKNCIAVVNIHATPCQAFVRLLICCKRF